MSERPTTRTRRAAAAVTAALVLVGALARPAQAQTPSSLGELSKKEAARRKTAPPPPKVYTNADLPPDAIKGTAPSAAAPAAASSTAAADNAAGQEKQDAKPQGGERDEAWWRARMAQLREELRRNEVFLEALQSRVNSLAADFLNRDDPYQRAKLGEDRAKANAEIVRVTEEVAKGRQAIADLEEEARKEGVPPGWLR